MSTTLNPTSSDHLPNAGKGWVVSAIVFASIELLIVAANAVGEFMGPHLETGPVLTTLQWVLDATDVWISIAFIVGGAQILRRIDRGLKLVAASALASCVQTVARCLVIYFSFKSASVQKFIVHLLAGLLGTNQADTSLAMTCMRSIDTALSFGLGIVLAFQIGYYLCLFRAMVKLRVAFR